jgi:hypothetical protein
MRFSNGNCLGLSYANKPQAITIMQSLGLSTNTDNIDLTPTMRFKSPDDLIAAIEAAFPEVCMQRVRNTRSADKRMAELAVVWDSLSRLQQLALLLDRTVNDIMQMPRMPPMDPPMDPPHTNAFPNVPDDLDNFLSEDIFDYLLSS